MLDKLKFFIVRVLDYLKQKIIYTIELEKVWENSIYEKLKSNSVIISKSDFKNEIEISFTKNSKSEIVFCEKGESDLFVFHQIFFGNELDYIIQLLENISGKLTILDLGANIGVTSLLFLNRFENCYVYCVEPFENNCKKIIRNLGVNYSDRYMLYQNVIWKDSRDMYLNTKFRDGKAWSMNFNDVYHANSKVYKAIPLNEIITQNEIKLIDFLKIDIEGAEENLLKDEFFLSSIRNYVRFISIEVHLEFISRESARNILLSNGFITFYHGELLIGLNRKKFE